MFVHYIQDAPLDQLDSLALESTAAISIQEAKLELQALLRQVEAYRNSAIAPLTAEMLEDCESSLDSTPAPTSESRMVLNSNTGGKFHRCLEARQETIHACGRLIVDGVSVWTKPTSTGFRRWTIYPHQCPEMPQIFSQFAENFFHLHQFDIVILQRVKRRWGKVWLDNVKWTSQASLAVAGNDQGHNRDATFCANQIKN